MRDDDFMTRLQESPRQAFADQLYRRITDPMATPTQPQRQLPARRLAFALTLLALFLAASLALSPAARALAGDVLRQIGAISVAPAGESGPIVPEATALPPQPAQMAASAAEARELAGFPLHTPTYVPAGYSQSDDYSVAPQGAGVIVATGYRAGNHFLIFNAYRYGEGDHFDQSLGPGEVAREVTVRDTTGLWITGRPMLHPDGTTSELLATSWLLWAEDGVNYTLFGDDLSLDEALKVAGGLAR